MFPAQHFSVIKWNKWPCLIGFPLWTLINLYHMSWGFGWRGNWVGCQPHFPSTPQGSRLYSSWSAPCCMLWLCLSAALLLPPPLVLTVSSRSVGNKVTPRGHWRIHLLGPFEAKGGGLAHSSQINNSPHPTWCTCPHSYSLFHACDIKVMSMGALKSFRLLYRIVLSSLHLRQTLHC